MNEQEEDAILQRFVTECVRPAAEKLALLQDDMRHRPNIAFAPLVDHLVAKALACFRTIAHVDDISEVNAGFALTAAGRIVAEFNAVLPIDYPYIIVLIQATAGYGELRCGTINRDAITRLGPLTESRCIPIIRVKKLEELRSPGLIIEPFSEET